MSIVIPQLKVLVFNAENLFLLSDSELKLEHTKFDPIQWNKLSTSIYENKPLDKLKKIAQIIFEEAPDLILLCEVGGFESLQNFNRLFLKETYSPALIEGNSDRHIDVGYLIKKNLGIYFDIVSNKNRPINYLYPFERQSQENGYALKKPVEGSHRFSRDVVELHLFQNKRDKPSLIILLTHLKSRLDPDGIDPNGFERRSAELKTLLEIYAEINSRQKEPVPMIVAGDFNGNASANQTDPEFLSIYQSTPLKDVCDLASLSSEKSATYYQVNRSSKAEGKQLDYAFLNPSAQSYLDKASVKVYRYKDDLGQEFDPPQSLDIKMSFPSDHYPLVFTLKNIPLK
jgi:hypothetical protein